MDNVTISFGGLVFFALLPFLFSIVLLSGVALGGFLVFKTKRGDDESLFAMNKSKIGGVTIAHGGPEEYGVLGDGVDEDPDMGTDADAALNKLLDVNARARDVFRAKVGK